MREVHPTTRAERVEVANRFLQVIASHGRRFFHHDGRVSRFELDHRGRVWLIDKWSGARIYTHHPGRWPAFGGNCSVTDLAPTPEAKP